MRKVKLAVGADGRNRTVLWPFKAKTSRTQPKASQWIFSPAVWLRSLIKPGPGMAVAYIDYANMEFLMAAVLSDGHCGPVNRMLDAYRSGDPYLDFAKRVRRRAAHSHQKNARAAAVQVQDYDARHAVRHGGGHTWRAALASRTSSRKRCSINIASSYAQYWKWSDDWVQHSLQTGVMRTAMGWTCRTGITEFNERSIRNWPIQSSGADILRIACIWALRRGVKVVAPVHDAVLIEAPIDRIEADVALMREIMRRASRIVLNADADGPYELRTDVSIVRFPDRYVDGRGEGIWDRVMALLDEQQTRRGVRTA